MSEFGGLCLILCEHLSVSLSCSHGLAWLAALSRRDWVYDSLSTADQAEGALKVHGTHEWFISTLMCCIKSETWNLQEVTFCYRWPYNFFCKDKCFRKNICRKIDVRMLTNPPIKFCIFHKYLDLFEAICLCGLFVVNHTTPASCSKCSDAEAIILF